MGLGGGAFVVGCEEIGGAQMKSSDVEILVIAGHTGAGDAHWQRRLIAKLSSARLVEQEDWLYGSLTKAVTALVEAVAAASKPVVFVAHSAGCILIAHAVAELGARGLIDKVKGGFLVTPTSVEKMHELQGIDAAFANVPRAPLPFPTSLVASSNDPYSTMEQSADLALAWGSKLIEAGAQGHINSDSGHGPWPEGMMSFAGFLSRLA